MDRNEILIMYGYGDRRITVKVCALFNEIHEDRLLIAQSIVSKIKEHEHFHDLRRIS